MFCTICSSDEHEAAACPKPGPRLHEAVFRLNDLVLVAPAPPPDSPPLGVGDYCYLNSGSPPLLVVDVEPEHVSVAWDGGLREARFPRACVRRKPTSPWPDPRPRNEKTPASGG